MIKKLVTIGLALLTFVIVGSILAHRVVPDEAEPGGEQLLAESVETPDNAWKDVFLEVTAYRPEAPKSSAKAADKQAEKVQTLQDGRIIGIVKGNTPRVLILPPGEKTAKAFAINQGWLNPWQLTAIEADVVTWTNKETGEEAKQYLFN